MTLNNGHQKILSFASSFFLFICQGYRTFGDSCYGGADTTADLPLLSIFFWFLSSSFALLHLPWLCTEAFGDSSNHRCGGGLEQLIPQQIILFVCWFSIFILGSTLFLFICHGYRSFWRFTKPPLWWGPRAADTTADHPLRSLVFYLHSWLLLCSSSSTMVTEAFGDSSNTVTVIVGTLSN